jgi:spermidine/putrescine transport system substrate-binding protein
MSQAYSGDVIQLQKTKKNLRFSIPEQGAVLWSDNMMIPQKPRTAYGAETFINYVYEPEVAAKIAAEVNYVTPVKGVKEVPRQERPQAREDPSSSRRRTCRLSGYPNLSVEEEQQMNALRAVVGA